MRAFRLRLLRPVLDAAGARRDLRRPALLLLRRVGADRSREQRMRESAGAALVDPEPDVEVGLRAAVDRAGDGELEAGRARVDGVDGERVQLRRSRLRPGRDGERGDSGEGGDTGEQERDTHEYSLVR